MDIIQNLNSILNNIPEHVTLVAVSKTKPASMIKDLHIAGHQDFGENKAQDLAAKAEELPSSIKWHMIGHMQTNKVKYIAPFVHLIHGVDSMKLLKVIQKEAAKNNRVISCLLQIHIANEETKFGLSEDEMLQLLSSAEFAEMDNIRISGLMGMATYTDDMEQVGQEFINLKRIFEEVKNTYFEDQDSFCELSMGMSADYELAVEKGSTMVRVGSLIFGSRNYH